MWKHQTRHAFDSLGSRCPGFTCCEQEVLSVTAATFKIEGRGASVDDQGRLLQVNQSTADTFRHMWRRNAKTNSVGVLTIIDETGLKDEGAFESGDLVNKPDVMFDDFE